MLETAIWCLIASIILRPIIRRPVQTSILIPTSLVPDRAGWRSLLLDDDDAIRRLIDGTRRIAVLGIKVEADRPAHYVPEYAQRAGFEIVPVPVYYPDVVEILGERVYRTVAAIPGDIDMVNVFRRSHDVPPHVDDILAKRPKSVWMQLGIRNDQAAERLARAGIMVVQNRCLMVELRRSGR
ncbi:MAG: CoA-binding protein [bacterium]